MNNIEDLKDDFPAMPEEIRIRINNEVYKQLNKEDIKMNEKNINSTTGRNFSWAKIAAGITAAAAAFAICIAIPQTRDKKNDTSDASDIVVVSESNMLTEQQPLAPNSFSMVSYTMDNDSNALKPSYLNEDGLLSFESTNGNSNYTGLIFKINGDNISHVNLSIDKNGFYSMNRSSHLSEADANALEEAIAESQTDDSVIAVSEYGDIDNDDWTVEQMQARGSSIDEDYDPDTYYGFYISDETVSEIAAADDSDSIKDEFHKGVDSFDGAKLDITVTFTDGTTKSTTYALSSGKLALAIDDDDHILGALNTFITSDDEPYVYGLLGVEE